MKTNIISPQVDFSHPETCPRLWTHIFHYVRLLRRLLQVFMLFLFSFASLSLLFCILCMIYGRIFYVLGLWIYPVLTLTSLFISTGTTLTNAFFQLSHSALDEINSIFHVDRKIVSLPKVSFIASHGWLWHQWLFWENISDRAKLSLSNLYSWNILIKIHVSKPVNKTRCAV